MPTFYASDACMESSMASTFMTGRVGTEGTKSYEHAGVTVDLGSWVDGPYFAGRQDEDRHIGLAPAHHAARLPKEFHGLANGHSGAHQFLVDDFIRACLEGALPPTHIWASAEWCAPGLVAHQSALQGGALLEVPDFGRPPADWALLTYPTRGDEPTRPRLPDLKAPAFPA